MQGIQIAILFLCAGSAAAFTPPNPHFSIRIAEKSLSPVNPVCKVKCIRHRYPVFPLRASPENNDDKNGGPLGNDYDMVPKESVDPAYFVIGGILGK